MIKIFLISGKAESGKNTVANFISDYYVSTKTRKNMYITDVAFADGVKWFATKMGWNGIKDEKGRALLQQLGACGRSYDKDIWASNTCFQILKLIKFHEMHVKDMVFCVTDLRFLNEITVMEDYYKYEKNVKIIKTRVERNLENHLTEEQKNDISETSLDDYKDWDKVFINDKDLEHLNEEVVNWLKTLD